ncbi:TAXI family TRAP transporter solute-binding subunit [Ideonella livida]|uniref:C4-dicarboxylate ABC transporter substrate-binding protein n=1 Tax=Ideonella livida TaxID=2707176 RepID=A0A7C9PGM2_9BURK|nr:TAXI family TRAP transporter solute-binding subunit [Ideonella livida]NDY90890.1 C4-dicarboxylate ABC transporter substrate-binding protein [Ideonella livida]
MNRLRLWLGAAREWAPAMLILVVAALVAVYVAYRLLDPTPPRRLVMATAGEQSAYHVLGLRYRDALRPYGITVELRNTAGSAENLRLLTEEDGPVDVAFVQGGTWQAPVSDEEELPELVALGGLFHEPVWVFYREDSAVRLLGGCDNRDTEAERLRALRWGARPARLKLAKSAASEPGKVVAEVCGELPGLHALRGWKVNAGADGSGVQLLSRRLLEAAGLDHRDLTLSHQANTPAVVELLEGRLDAMVFISAPEASLIQMLLQTPGIKLMSFEQSQAYARKLPFLSAVTLPRGVVDLGRDLPSRDIQLVAPTASLVARESLHPALVQLLMQAAGRVHGTPGWFARAGEFPHAEGADFPLADEATRYYKSGKPLLQRYMPFWMANLIDRMWVALLSIMVVLIPLSRLLPPLYVFRMRSRVFRWYARLREIETAGQGVAADHAALLAELAELEQRVGQVKVPLSYAEELYALRQHIDMVRARLQEGGSASPAA